LWKIRDHKRAEPIVLVSVLNMREFKALQAHTGFDSRRA
jgi:hypothetical protein